MPAAINPTFTPLTDPVIWFATVQAFNQFIGSLSFTVDSVNLPPATTEAIGGVKMAELASYTPAVLAPTYVNMIADEDGDGVPEQYPVPTRVAYDALQAKLDALATSYDNLLTALEAAGILDIT